MSFRDDLIAMVDEIRGDVLDTELGMRLHTVETVLRTWSGTRPGDGTPTDVVVVLDPPPKVLTPRGRQQDGGREQRVDLVVSKISAALAESALTGGTLAANQRFYWRITDGDGGTPAYYWLQGMPEKRTLEWQVNLRALRPLDAVSVSATVITPTARSMDPASGLVSETATSTSLTAWVGPTALGERGAEEDLVQRRGLTLYVLTDELPTRPTVASRFQVDGRTYRVAAAEVEPYGLYWKLLGEESS